MSLMQAPMHPHIEDSTFPSKILKKMATQQSMQALCSRMELTYPWQKDMWQHVGA